MYVLDQDLANDIAAKVPLKYEYMRRMFEANEETANEMEARIREEAGKRTKFDKAARAVMMYAPLLMEHEAISKYQELTGQYIRNVAPEILTAREAALIAQKDIMMTEQETLDAHRLFDLLLNGQAAKNESPQDETPPLPAKKFENKKEEQQESPEAKPKKKRKSLVSKIKNNLSKEEAEELDELRKILKAELDQMNPD